MHLLCIVQCCIMHYFTIVPDRSLCQHPLCRHPGFRSHTLRACDGISAEMAFQQDALWRCEHHCGHAVLINHLSISCFGWNGCALRFGRGVTACQSSGERTAERHCGRVTLVCEVGNRARPDCRRQIGIPHSLEWGLGGAAAGFPATTAARRVRTGPTAAARRSPFVS